MDAHMTTLVAATLIDDRIREAAAYRAARDASRGAGSGGVRERAAGLRRTWTGALGFGRVTVSRR
jgi:hypothetical protein